MTSPAVKKKKILLIDDDLLVLRTIENLLEREGYDCLGFSLASSAIEKFSEEFFDLVISDIRMPGKNGVEAAREISKLFRENSREDLPIIFITGFADLATELQAEQLGEVILKPFDLNRFVMTIREYL